MRNVHAQTREHSEPIAAAEKNVSLAEKLGDLKRIIQTARVSQEDKDDCIVVIWPLEDMVSRHVFAKEGITPHQTRELLQHIKGTHRVVANQLRELETLFAARQSALKTENEKVVTQKEHEIHTRRLLFRKHVLDNAVRYTKALLQTVSESSLKSLSHGAWQKMMRHANALQKDISSYSPEDFGKKNDLFSFPDVIREWRLHYITLIEALQKEKIKRQIDAMSIDELVAAPYTMLRDMYASDDLGAYEDQTIARS